MKVRLEYVSFNKRVLLEDMELEELDQYTYKTFETVEEIKKTSKYKTKIGQDSSDGDVKIFFDTSEIPLRDLDKYANLGGNPLGSEECISVLTHSDKVSPCLRGVRTKMASFINSVEVAREFNEYFKNEYTSKEQLDFVLGMEIENTSMATSGIRRIMGEYTSGYEGYFLGRVFVDTMRTFDSVKKATMTSTKK